MDSGPTFHKRIFPGPAHVKCLCQDWLETFPLKWHLWPDSSYWCHRCMTYCWYSRQSPIRSDRRNQCSSHLMMSMTESHLRSQKHLSPHRILGRDTHSTQMMHWLELQQAKYKSHLQNLPIVAEIMIYDTVVQKIASSVPLGIATVGFWVTRWFTKRFLMYTFCFLLKYFLQIPFKQAYFQISRDVCSSQDSRCRGKENREHSKEAALWSTPVGDKISGKNMSCWRQIKGTKNLSESLLYVGVYVLHLIKSSLYLCS